jgi:peptidoglycan/LPS O-acetylase OafA/YrhL
MSTLISRKLDMNPTTSRLVAAGALFLLTIISGMILSQSNRPLNIGLVTVHKLIAAGSIVLLGMVINQLFKTVDSKGVVELSLTIIGAMSFLALIATGALLTREEMELPGVVLTIHRAGPVVALVASTIATYLLNKGQS